MVIYFISIISPTLINWNSTERKNYFFFPHLFSYYINVGVMNIYFIPWIIIHYYILLSKLSPSSRFLCPLAISIIFLKHFITYSLDQSFLQSLVLLIGHWYLETKFRCSIYSLLLRCHGSNPCQLTGSMCRYIYKHKYLSPSVYLPTYLLTYLSIFI